MQTPVENHFEKCTMAVPDRILVATDLTDTDCLVPTPSHKRGRAARASDAHSRPSAFGCSSDGWGCDSVRRQGKDRP